MSETCGHCRIRVAAINTSIGKPDSIWRCIHCYGVEQQIQQKQDWRDTKCKSFAIDKGLVRKPEETTTNLNNRCKIFLAANGFNFETGE